MHRVSVSVVFKIVSSNIHGVIRLHSVVSIVFVYINIFIYPKIPRLCISGKRLNESKLNNGIFAFFVFDIESNVVCTKKSVHV